MLMVRLVCVLLAVASCGGKEETGGGGGGDTAAKPVLPRVETWKRPDADKTELYDSIKKALTLKEAAKVAGMDPPASTTGAMPLPKTLTDTFAADVRMIAFFDLGMGKLEPGTITATQVTQVLDLYPKIESRYLHGYRGDTHRSFVTSLQPDERKQLATELVEHIKKHGFTGHDSIADLPKRPMAKEVEVALGGKPIGTKPADPPATTGGPLYAGKYRTSEGWMTLKQKAADPTDVFGTYAKGSIKCKASGDTLACDWNEGGVSKGRAKFTRDASGNMRGTWGNGGAAAGGGAWNCTLLAAGAME